MNDAPVLGFWRCLFGVSNLEWGALVTLGRAIHVTCYLRFTSGVIPADLLAASGLFYIPVGRHWLGSKLGSIVLQTNTPRAMSVLYFLN